MAHEKSRSFNIDGKEMLFSSVDSETGKDLSDDEIMKRFRDRRLKPLGVFNTPEEATAFAKERSQRFDDINSDNQFEDFFDGR